ncbi:isopentenyl-diphosphate Delta-isomerase [Microbacterium suaedae]|uniref:isopentenyl-diphosphate Delta-isomerase n=1 Tax=Microbacterium suaedae TaxID=2067813 RepID=UPI0013A63447
MEEVVLVDGDGVAVGTHPKATVHGVSTPRHLAFSCHVVREDGAVLLTRRALGKRTWPGVWTNTFCGHPQPGETWEDALHRRAEFELGLEIEIVSCPLPDFGYTARDASGIEENEHCPVFVARALSEPAPNRDEVAEIRWVEQNDLAVAVGAAPWAFSPWLVSHLDGVLAHLPDATNPSGAVLLESAFESRLDEILAGARARALPCSPAFVDLWNSIESIVRGGKRIRPQLVLDAYRGFGGRKESIAVDAACAVELLHAALVTHDDVIDGDLTRRGRENVAGWFATDARQAGASAHASRTWGDASAIIAGDLMLTTAHGLIAGLACEAWRRDAALKIFDETVFESAAGEHADVRLSLQLETASPEEIMATAERKTAVYSFRAPLLLGAILAGAPSGAIDELDGIARDIGVIYQLRDDVLGVFGDERETGKSVLSDLREGKETLLISYARSHSEWATVAPHVGDSELTAAEGARIRDVVERSGARRKVEATIEERRVEATRRLRNSGLPADLVAILMEVSESCSTRRS